MRYLTAVFTDLVILFALVGLANVGSASNTASVQIYYGEDNGIEWPHTSCSHTQRCSDTIAVQVTYTKAFDVPGYIGLYDENWNWIDGDWVEGASGTRILIAEYHDAPWCSCQVNAGFWFHVMIEADGSDQHEDWLPHGSANVDNCFCPGAGMGEGGQE